MVELQVVPDAQKSKVVVPVYKEGMKNSLDIDSYIGVIFMFVIG